MKKKVGIDVRSESKFNTKLTTKKEQGGLFFVCLQVVYYLSLMQLFPYRHVLLFIYKTLKQNYILSLDILLWPCMN